MKKGGKLEGWKVEKLGDVIQLEYGKPLPPSKRSEKGKYPVYGANGEIARSNEYYYDKPTMIVGRKGSAGEINLTEKKFWALDVTYFVTFDDKKYDLQFLYYLLSKLELTKLAKGVKPGINRNDVYSIEVAIPPLPEQQRIVHVLDEAFASIAQAKSNAERNLVNARELFEAIQRELFDGIGNKKSEVKMLGDIATFRNGINFTKASKGETVNIVGVKDFQNYFWVPLDNLDSVTIDGKLNETDYLRKGDILAVRSNGNQQLIGRSILAGDVTEKTTHSGFTIRIRFETKDVFPEYLCHYLKSEKARKQLISGGAGISIKSLNQTTLSELPISLPPLAEQRAIVGRLEALSAETGRLEEIYQSKVEGLEELKRSVLGKAFGGEL